MKSFAALALVGAAAALPNPQAVTSAISPSASAPAGCSASYDGTFEISVVNVSSSAKRDLQRRADLTLTLQDGVLVDSEDRTGYIASNDQFQFDSPIQAGAIYTAGWSVCSNGTLALGDSAVFYQCLSGTFYNLYDESTGAQCNQIYIDVVPVGATAGVASTIADGQVTASAASVTQITDGQVQASTAAVVTQITDGQIQASTAAVVTQITDGQIQATTGTGAVVTQISDGQIQAATTPAVVTQITDGQIQAPTATGAVVSQISDGQIQAATNGTASTVASATLSASSTYTGGAAAMKTGFFGLAAGAVAIAML